MREKEQIDRAVGTTGEREPIIREADCDGHTGDGRRFEEALELRRQFSEVSFRSRSRIQWQWMKRMVRRGFTQRPDQGGQIENRPELVFTEHEVQGLVLRL